MDKLPCNARPTASPAEPKSATIEAVEIPNQPQINTIKKKYNIAFAKEFLGLNETEGYNWGIIRALMTSNANTTIIQFQDLLGLGSEARMNTPSSVGTNWLWRAKEGSFDSALAQKLLHKTQLYIRTKTE